jgi:hypothetical protein
VLRGQAAAGRRAVRAAAGLLSGNVPLVTANLAVALLLVALAVRSRRRCDGSCHAPALLASGPPHRHDAPSTAQCETHPELDTKELP